MTRRTERLNREWETPSGDDFKWEHVSLEVLMDIRTELALIRKLLECGNVQRMLRTIERLDRRVAAAAPLRKRK